MIPSAGDNTKGARPTGLAESRSKLNWMSLHSSTDGTQLASAWMGLSSLKLGHLNELRDSTDKWLCGCLISARGLAFEDLSTPGETSRRDFCLQPNHHLLLARKEDASLPVSDPWKMSLRTLISSLSNPDHLDTALTRSRKGRTSRSAIDNAWHSAIMVEARTL